MKGKMHGNMRDKGHTSLPSDDHRVPPAHNRKDYDRLEANETSYYDEQTRPGPVVSHPRKRGKRISKRRSANEAAQALSKSMEKGLREYTR